MSLTSTSPLPVAKIISISPTSPKLSFILAPPFAAPLFLGSIVITRTTVEGLSSSMTPGTDATHPGKLLLDVDATLFASLLEQATLPFKVVVSYDTLTNDVSRIDIFHDGKGASLALVEPLGTPPV